MGKPVTEKEHEMFQYVVDYVKRNGLEKDDAVALGLLCRGDTVAEKMIRILKENPKIDFDELIKKAVEISN